MALVSCINCYSYGNLINIFRNKVKVDVNLLVISFSLTCSVITLIYNLIISGYNLIAVPVLVLMLVVRIISAIVIDGFVTKLLADGLAKAGVLKGYAISQGMSQDLED